MSTMVLIILVLIIGIYIGFIIGFSRAIREAVGGFSGTNRHIIGWLAAIMGGLFIVIAIGFWVYTCYFVHAAIHATGTVIAMQQQTDKDSSIVSYAPTFRFQDAAGIPHTISSELFQAPPEFQVGDTVDILYLRNTPQRARINSFSQVWGLPAGFACGGFIISCIGLFILIVWPKILARLGR